MAMDLPVMNYCGSIFRLFLAIAACCYFSGASSAYAESTREYQIKAAFLYNFAKFVEWPADRFTDENSPMLLCVIGMDPFGPTLEQTVTGRKIKGRAIRIKRIKGINGLKRCHVLFVSSSERENIRDIVASLAGASVLTTGDMDRFANQGGIINLIKRGNKIRFEINSNAAAQSGLKLSSYLMGLASNIIE
ncbi:MAG: YfiR family protein [Nitrospirae bacterium]|nr:YfiR family protein [Nitrospirota bacterium]